MHALFKCKAHEFIRYRYIEVLEKSESVCKFIKTPVTTGYTIIGEMLKRNRRQYEEVEDDSIVQR